MIPKASDQEADDSKVGTFNVDSKNNSILVFGWYGLDP